MLKKNQYPAREAWQKDVTPGCRRPTAEDELNVLRRMLVSKGEVREEWCANHGVMVMMMMHILNLMMV